MLHGCARACLPRTSLPLQVLLWLAYVHAHGGEPGSCLSCLETLAQAGSALLDMAEVAALRIR